MNNAAIGEKNSPGVSASIGGENHLRFSLAIKFAAIVVFPQDQKRLKIRTPSTQIDVIKAGLS